MNEDNQFIELLQRQDNSNQKLIRYRELLRCLKQNEVQIGYTNTNGRDLRFWGVYNKKNRVLIAVHSINSGFHVNFLADQNSYGYLANCLNEFNIIVTQKTGTLPFKFFMYDNVNYNVCGLFNKLLEIIIQQGN